MIVVFGSLNADLIFEVEHPPETGQTILARQFRMEAGGKGANQAVAAARDGAEVAMAGALGSDPLRHIALSHLETSGVDVSRVATTPQPTGCASIIVDAQGGNQIAVALGANALATAAQIDDALLDQASWLLLQMESAPSEVAALLERAQGRRVRTILNLAPAVHLAPQVLRSCDLLVVNESEAAAVAGWLGCGDDARQLQSALGNAVLRTLGARGAELATSDGLWSVPAIAVDAVDTTAAGDCFVGVLAAALDRGMSLPDAMQRATQGAALACTRQGSQTSLPWRSDIDALQAQMVAHTR